MKRGIFALLILALIAPNIVLAHPEPIKTQELYVQEVFITEVTIDDDDNWFGPADMFFDWIVDPLDPKHEEQAGITDQTVPINSGETISFDPPIKIYSHNTCHCDEEFDIDVAVFDYAPIKNALWNMLGKGIEYLKSYLLYGSTGVAIALIGDIVDFVMEKLAESGMSDDEAEYQAYVQLIEDSNLLGAMRHILETGCDPAKETYSGELELDEYINGSLSYQVVKTKTKELCIFEEEIITVPDDEEEELPPEEPGDADAPPEFDEPEAADDVTDEPEEEPVTLEPEPLPPVEDVPEEEPVVEPVEEDPPIEPDPEPYCGDGVVDQNEKCDDGNTTSGDGCSADCNIEEEPEEPVEDLPTCLPDSGLILVDNEYVCPAYSSLKAGVCMCHSGYTYNNYMNLCEGCVLAKE